MLHKTKQQKLTNLYQTQLFHEEPYILLAFYKYLAFQTASQTNTGLYKLFHEKPDILVAKYIISRKPP
jgi:hypothetical protein